MSDTPLPPDAIPSTLAADLLGVSIQALSQWRSGGIGPRAYPTLKGKTEVFYYSRRDVLEHLRGRLGIEDRIARLEDRLDRLEASP